MANVQLAILDIPSIMDFVQFHLKIPTVSNITMSLMLVLNAQIDIIWIKLQAIVHPSMFYVRAIAKLTESVLNVIKDIKLVMDYA